MVRKPAVNRPMSVRVRLPQPFAFVVKRPSHPASNGKVRVQLLARAPLPGGVTVACLSYKEKDLVRFKAGEPFSGLSVTEAYSPRTGVAGVRLPQPRPILSGIGREVRQPASTRTRGERYPYPAPYRRCSPTEEAPRSERGQCRFESCYRHQIDGGKRFRVAGESHTLLMVGSSPTPARFRTPFV